LTYLYHDIFAIAVRALHRERDRTICPTALVHEVYLRLVTLRHIRWHDRAHFLSMAARVTRQALIDEARRRRADKRDGDGLTLSNEHQRAGDAVYDPSDVDLLLTDLQRFDDVTPDIVSLRVFGGMSIVEAAEALHLSVRTVNRRWVTGKAWLTRELTGGV
jgi:RNA polymerase sigma factor (TIGR02999 family)